MIRLRIGKFWGSGGVPGGNPVAWAFDGSRLVAWGDKRLAFFSGAAYCQRNIDAHGR